MDATELCYTPATELRRLIDSKGISPVEIADAVLARIERLNPTLNAFLTVTADIARGDARAAEQRQMRGERLSPIDGIPFSIKDLEPTAGVRTTFGSKWFEHNVPTADGVAAGRLRNSGAIFLGKTNTPHFGYKDMCDNMLGEPCQNPWKLGRTSGASSGGAGAAVAAGLGPLAEGSDLAASIRQPAAWCGVVGFKPSQGRVPRHPQTTGWSGLSVNGPLARTVQDAALMFATLAGPDPRDPLALPDGGEDWCEAAEESELGGLRVAWSADLGGAAPVDAEVARVCAEAARAFGELGSEPDEAAPEIGEIRRPFLLLNSGLRQATLGRYLDEWRDRMDPVLVRRLEVTGSATAVDVAQADVARLAYHLRLVAFFERYDLLLLPTAATAALPVDVQFPIEIEGQAVREPFDMLLPTYAFNFSNFPAISVPAGRTADGLPVGLQIVGGWQQDALVLRAAAAFEAARPWADRRPPLE